MLPSIKYIFILIATFAASHFFFSLLEKSDQLPAWLNPIRGALIVTFMVQVWMVIKFTQSGLPMEAP